MTLEIRPQNACCALDFHRSSNAIASTRRCRLLQVAQCDIGTAKLRFMAQRNHATTVEVKRASHVVMIPAR
jgi:hypothetical protein